MCSERLVNHRESANFIVYRLTFFYAKARACRLISSASCIACHRSYCACCVIQLSALPPNAFDRRMAISGDISLCHSARQSAGSLGRLYQGTPPRNPQIPLTLAKNPHFRIGNTIRCPAFEKQFMDGHYLFFGSNHDAIPVYVRRHLQQGVTHAHVTQRRAVIGELV